MALAVAPFLFPSEHLLGLAVRRNGILVSMDKGMAFLAGSKFSRNVLILE
jgi:hypothetical protein